MQFEPATFALYAVKADPGAPLSPYNPADAIYTAAAMLCANGAASGAETGTRQAIFAYNHSSSYVTDVFAWAARYTAQAPASAAAAAIAFALRQVGKPYQWGAAGPDAYDCSGLVFAAYAAAGIHIARTTFGWWQDGPTVPLADIEPGDLLFSTGTDGTTANPGHVVMYLGGGQIIQAPQTGAEVSVPEVMERADCPSIYWTILMSIGIGHLGRHPPARSCRGAKACQSVTANGGLCGPRPPTNRQRMIKKA